TGIKHTRILGVNRARAECLKTIAQIVVRSVQLPPQTVVQSQIRFQLETVLREQVESRIANILRLSGTLGVEAGFPNEVVRVEVIGADVVLTTCEVQKLTIYIKEQELIEPRAPNITAEFDGVFADRLGEVVRPLEGVPHLRQFAFKIVTDGEAATDTDIRHT